MAKTKRYITKKSDDLIKAMKDYIPQTISNNRLHNIYNLIDTIIADVCKDFDRKKIIEDLIYVQYKVSILDPYIVENKTKNEK